MASKHDPNEQDVLEGVSLRRKVSQKVLADIDGASLLAKSIKHPWYRCQSLATIAEHANGTFVSDILRESFESAMMCHDENRRVSVACWSIRVALELGKMDLARRFLDGCIYQLTIDRDPISKWCATSVLNTIKKNDNLLHYFFEAFKNATSEGHGWRVERSIKNLVNDALIQRDQRYIDYLCSRKADIEEWKKSHKERNHN